MPYNYIKIILEVIRIDIRAVLFPVGMLLQLLSSQTMFISVGPYLMDMKYECDNVLLNVKYVSEPF